MTRLLLPPRRRVLSAAAVLAAGGLAAGAEVPAREARLLLDGRVRPGAWAVVQVPPPAVPAPGALVARVGPATYRLAPPFPVRSGEPVPLPVFIPLSVPAVRVVSGGAPSVEPAVTEVPAGDLLVGVEPAQAGGLGLPVREALEGGRAVHWVSLDRADLLRAPEALDALDGMVGAVPDSKDSPALEAHLVLWLGRGGRLFRDVAAARGAAAGGWTPARRAGEGMLPMLRDLLPRAGMPPGRLHGGRVAAGLLLVLGAAAVALAGWRRLRPRAAAAGVAGLAIAGCGIVLALVPAAGAVIRAAAVREIVQPAGAAAVRMAESVEGFAALETAGSARAGVLFPPRTRVSVAAAGRMDAGAAAVIESVPGGCEASEDLPAGGRRIFRFSRPGPAAEWLRARVTREGGGPARLSYETTFEGVLAGAVLVIGGTVYALGDIPPQPASGERVVAEGAVDWSAWLRQAGPPGDPRRALLEWWGARRGGGAWLLATPAGDPPVLLAGVGAEAEVAWGPVVVAVKVLE